MAQRPNFGEFGYLERIPSDPLSAKNNAVTAASLETMKRASVGCLLEDCLIHFPSTSGGYHVVRWMGRSLQADYHHLYPRQRRKGVGPMDRQTARSDDGKTQDSKAWRGKFQACYEASTGYGVYYELLSSVAGMGERPTARFRLHPGAFAGTPMPLPRVGATVFCLMGARPQSG